MKLCEICGTEFFRKPGEGAGNFNRKKTCSLECSKLLMRQKKLLEIPPKTCKICGEIFSRRDNEETKDYNKRITCSPKCGNIAISNTLIKYSIDDKVCAFCGETFSIHASEKPATYDRRITCSQACAGSLRGKARYIEFPPKACAYCGKLFSRRSNEVSTDFKNRKTCSEKCSNVYAGLQERVDAGVRICEHCGKEFTRKAPVEKVVEFVERKTCSTECSIKLGMHSEESREKTRVTMLERYGVPYYVMTKECRGSYNTVSKPNREFAARLEAMGLEVELEFSLGKYSYDLKVDNCLIEINPFPFHNVTFSPFDSPPSKGYHKEKTDLAKENGYRCIHIWDWDDLDKVANLLSPRDTYYARKLSLKEVSQEGCKDFLREYHLQNHTMSQPIRLGLYDSDELIMVMTFGKPRYNSNYEYELLRLATKTGCKVVGGANKLFKYFLSNYSPNNVISYCDMAKFTGDVYSNLGFTLLKENQPSRHWYHPEGKHFTDNQLRKQGFDRLVGRDYGVTYGKGTSNEKLMLNYGYVEIYDSGQNSYMYSCEIE